LFANFNKALQRCQREYLRHIWAYPVGGWMDIDVRKQSNAHVIRLKGDLKIGQPAEDLRKTFEELLANNEVRLVTNMQNVNMVDSSGIGVLVRCLTTAKKSGGSLKLVSPSKLTLQTLKMVGLLPLFEVYNEESEAVDTFA